MVRDDSHPEVSAGQPVSRRTFVRGSLMLLSAGLGSSLLAACGGQQPAPTAVPPKPTEAAKPAAPPAQPAQPAPAAPAQPAAQPAAQAPAAAKTKNVSIRFNWTIKGEFTPFFVAQEKGFYKEAGLQVELGEGKSGTQAVQVVGSNNDQFGYVPSVQVIQGVNQGIPLRSVAVCGKNTGMCWASWPNVPLDGPRALEGHKVSISTSSTFFQVWEAFARKFNVDMNKVEQVQADPSARVGLFMSRQVEIMADIFLANDLVILQTRAKEPLNVLKMSDLNFDPLGYLLVVNKSVLDSDKELVKTFTQASLKGFQYLMDQPAESTQIMAKLHGDRLGADVLDGQVKNLVPLVQREPTLGKADNAAWDRSLDILLDSGVIDKKLALTDYFTNEFVGG